MNAFHSNGAALRCELGNNIESIAAAWARLKADNVFLSVEYLRSLELGAPKDMQFYYMIVYRGEDVIGKCYFQLKDFVPSESLQSQNNSEGFYCILGKVAKGRLGRLNVRLMVWGNLLLTGQNAYAFDQSRISETEFRAGVLTMLTSLSKKKLDVWPKYDVLLIKDYQIDNRMNKSSDLYEFQIEPAMNIEIRDHWKDFDAYLGDLHSKYRVRAKRAFKKLGSVEKRMMSIDEVERRKDEMYQLYKNIARQVAFNIVNLNEDYFICLMDRMPDRFKIIGYFDNDKLIAFYSYVDAGDLLEAYYVGMDGEYNKTHQVYLNILFDFLREAITLQKKKLSLSRTALEIKSSVGALAEEKYCYLRHNNKLMRLILPSIMKYFTQQPEWVARTPFKDNIPELAST